jgi:cytochrome c-type biogenesis protein CcmE
VTAPTSGPGIDQPDDRDLDDGGLDLSPRDVAAAPPRNRARRRWGSVIVLALLGIVLVFIVIQARGASLYFKNADEAVAQKASLGTKDFRLQGTVVGKPRDGADATYFTVEYNHVKVHVRHTGSEPAMFQPGIPVVAEGHWNEAGTRFESSRLLVKHDESYDKYDKDHPGRVKPQQQSKKQKSDT